MFGLLGGYSPEDQRLLMLAAAQGLLSQGSGGNAGAVSRGLSGLLGGVGMVNRNKEEELQRQLYQGRIDDMNQMRANQSGMRQAFQSAFSPNQNLVQNDDMGNPMPSSGGGGMPEFLRRAAPYMDPMQAIGMMQKQGPLKLGKDDRLVDPTTYKELVGAAPEAQKPPTGMREVNGRWEYDPAYLKGQTDLAAARRPQVSVTNVGEREEQKQLGALRVKNYADIQGAANAARKEMALLSGLEKIPLETGKLTPANATVAAWLTAVGAKNKDLDRIASGAQTFEAFTNDLVMQQQLAQKGPQTESDARRLEATQARVSNTPEANKLNISFRKALAKRTIEQERFYSDWARKNKGSLEGAEAAWFSGKGGASIWDEPELKKFQSASGGNDVIDFSRLPK